MVAADPWIGRVLSGRYRLVRAIGSGGAGAVYEAEQLGLGRHVAIKLMRRELAGSHAELERFRREARAAAMLGHPNIVQLHDFVEPPAASSSPDSAETPYLVMELVRGRSLFEVIRNEAPLAPARAVSLAIQILSALDAAHRAGIVHRDMKPGNVVVSEVPGLGEVAKVLDFGIARIQGSTAYQRLTQTGEIIGTPKYMSPEQTRGSTVDARSDLWSVAVILYGALAGRFPFEGPPAEVIPRILSSPVPPLGRPDVPAQLEAVLRRALEKRAEDRFASAMEMAEALRAAATAERATQTQTAARAVVSPPPAEVPRPAVARTQSIVSHTGARLPLWAQVLIPVAALLALGVVVLTIALAVVLSSRTGRASHAGPQAPTAPAEAPRRALVVPNNAPTRGTSDVFLPDAVQHARVYDPGARLSAISGSGMDLRTGAVDISEGDSLSFLFVRPDRRSFQVTYFAGMTSYPVVDDLAAPLQELSAEPPSSGLVMAAAVRGCPALTQARRPVLSISPALGTVMVSVMESGGATWAGELDRDGRSIRTTFCRGAR